MINGVQKMFGAVICGETDSGHGKGDFKPAGWVYEIAFSVRWRRELGGDGEIRALAAPHRAFRQTDRARWYGIRTIWSLDAFLEGFYGDAQAAAARHHGEDPRPLQNVTEAVGTNADGQVQHVVLFRHREDRDRVFKEFTAALKKQERAKATAKPSGTTLQGTAAAAGETDMHVIYNDALILAYGQTRADALAMLSDCYTDVSATEDDIEEGPPVSGSYGEGMYWGEATPALAAELLRGGGDSWTTGEDGLLDVRG
jgi:hypothetical protein